LYITWLIKHYATIVTILCSI